jgi:hypothetical protein
MAQRPEAAMCGDGSAHALRYLAAMEAATA